MSTFIKPGFWEKRKLAPNHWLNLDQLITSLLPTSVTKTSQLENDGADGTNPFITAQDIPPPTLPYKVFTALLTQSGGDDIFINNSTDFTYPFIIGVTYYIDKNNDTSADFTNIGAPNNNVGTYFIATGTTPNSWGNGGYVNLRYNIGAPIAIVLENTIGNVWFTYNSVGYYDLNSNGLFLDGKVYPEAEGINLNISSCTSWTRVDNNSLRLFSTDLLSTSPSNDLLDNTPIEIRVYS